MAIVDDTDIQIHLPVDKLKVEEIPDALKDVKTDVERIIRGSLAGVIDSAAMALWTAPEDTPALVRAIGGRLGAALIYRLRYSEDSLDDPQYAQVKYNEGMSMLEKVISGKLIIEELPTDTTGAFSSSFFYPNNSAPDPKFTMESQF
jgi:hypothetical protein